MRYNLFYLISVYYEEKKRTCRSIYIKIFSVVLREREREREMNKANNKCIFNDPQILSYITYDVKF